jgi:hypothetical protein
VGQLYWNIGYNTSMVIYLLVYHTGICYVSPTSNNISLSSAVSASIII